MDTLGGMQEVTIINESGMYSLILSSKLPTAKKFKWWVTTEVLPHYPQNRELQNAAAADGLGNGHEMR